MHVCRVLSIALVITAAPAIARAYEVKTSSTGKPVHWAAGDILLTLALDPGAPGVPTEAATAAIDTSLATWQTPLATRGLSLAAQAGGAAVTDPADGANTVRWALDAADPDIEQGVLALTFVSFRTADGAIQDADIVLNAADFTWTTVPGADCRQQYDLLAALAHEVGHFLGMAHSIGHPEATMFATGTACETLKRDLAADDVAGIEALYPVPVDLTPPPAFTCAAGVAGASSGSRGSVGLVVIAGVIARRRRRDRRRRGGAGVIAAVVIAALVVTRAPAAHAAQLRHLALDELARGADLIVRGRVLASTPTADGPIATDSTIAIDECLADAAGACPTAVTVRRRGGERDGLGLWVDGEADLARGDEVVVYLRADARGHLRVIGGVQGALRVVRVGDRAYAVRDLRGEQVLVDGGWRPGAVEVIDLAAIRRSAAARDAR